MKRSEFRRAVDAEFGARGASLVQDLVLSAIGDRTAADALAAGVAPRDIWFALCAATDVPESHRYGAGRVDPRRS